MVAFSTVVGDADSGEQGGKQEVNIVTTRFGLIQASESEIVRIPEGLVGFRSFTQYIHLPDPVVAGLSWLQSVTAPDLAFGLIAPPLAVSDYRVELRPGDRAALELDEERSALVYVILNRGDGGGLTVNLQGPLVFNPVRRLGRQLVLTSSRYAVRYPLEGQAPALALLPGPSPLRATA
jgi:flagellar assembly factor FliW